MATKEGSHGKKIYSIGHSDRDRQQFLEVLFGHDIEAVADVRRYPSSRKFPHFNSGNMSSYLSEQSIRYETFGDGLGGYVGSQENEDKIGGWKADGFKQYAAYARTASFQEALKGLMELARHHRTAFLCAEGYYRRCHRQIIADYLVAHDWTVYHISSPGSCTKHELRDFASIEDRRVSYED